MTDSTAADTTARSSALRAARRWRLVVRACQISLAVLVAFGVWSIGFASDDGPAPVVPETQEQFSLDMIARDTVDHPLIYAVEQRARPAYRIFSLDPSTGDDETVFTVPDDAIIFGIALHHDGTTMAVTWSPDFSLEGSGLALLDIESGEMTTVLDVETDVYHLDPAWSADGTSVLTTRVDRRGDTEQLDVARITAFSDGSNAPGTVDVVATNAINPVATGGDIAYLAVDSDGARRSVSTAAAPDSLIIRGDLDLDHLVADSDGSLRVAAIDAVDTDTASIAGITFGQAAAAHGNHDRPSTWWDLDVSLEAPASSDAEPIITHDAAFGDDAIVYATGEGISILQVGVGASDVRIDLIASRAVRFVTA